jgi:ribosomal protein S12
MPTLNQLVRKGRRIVEKHKKTRALQACPQKRGVLREGVHHHAQEAQLRP